MLIVAPHVAVADSKVLACYIHPTKGYFLLVFSFKNVTKKRLNLLGLHSVFKTTHLVMVNRWWLMQKMFLQRQFYDIC